MTQRITEFDIRKQYNQETGIGIGSFGLNNKEKDEYYYKWVEEKYIEKLNQEIEMNNLFFEDDGK